MKKQLLSILMMASVGSAVAQGAYATIVDVEGLVTVTTNNQLSNAVKGMPLVKGGQVLATGSGAVTIVFSNGCKASLKPGQSLPIDEAACATFVASNSPTGFASLSPTTLGLLGVGGLALLAARNNNAATPAIPAAPAVPPPVSGS